LDATLRSIHLLNNQFKDSKDTPNESLNKFLQVDVEIKQKVIDRVNSLIGLVFFQFHPKDKINFDFSYDAKECTLKKSIAKKLYYE
jgi:hypothetical protein